MPSIYDPRYAELRQRLREARLAAGLTQVEAAQALGTNQQFINRCEAGDRRIDFLEVCDFATLYAVPLDSFTPSAGLARATQSGVGDDSVNG